MGLFDYVRCEHELPDGYDGPLRKQFQTKSLNENYLARYVITKEGRLIDPNGKDADYHGDVTFYQSNFSGIGAHGYATKDDKPLDSRRYTARFTNGQLEWIKGGSDAEEAAGGLPHLTEDDWWEKRTSPKPPGALDIIII